MKYTALVFLVASATQPLAAGMADLDLSSLLNPDAIALTRKLTDLRDIGGYTEHNAIACISPSKYDEYLRAVWGEAKFYPTKSECWRVEYNKPIKATGKCSDVGTTRDPSSLSQYSVLVCEFNTDEWFSSPIWLKASDTKATKKPKPK